LEYLVEVWKRQLKAPGAIVVALGIVELGAMDVEFARRERLHSMQSRLRERLIWIGVPFTSINSFFWRQILG